MSGVVEHAAQGAGDRGETQAAACETLPVQRDELDCDRDAERRDREIVAAQSDCGEADDQRSQRGTPP